jgi:hypothetical protein
VGKKDSLRGWKKALAKLASKLKKLLANSKFHLHLASWRVVISTPVAVTTEIGYSSLTGQSYDT